MKLVVILTTFLGLSTAHLIPKAERIFGGQEARRNEIPYQIGMVTTSLANPNQESWCGGVLISNIYILTAAHCLFGARSARIIIGALDRLNNAESGRVTQTIGRNNFIIHPGYTGPSNTIHDIALIRIDRVRYSPSIQPIALASRVQQNENFVGVTVTASGWGFYDTTDNLAQILRYAESTIISNRNCENTYGSIIQSRQICVNTSHGRSTCDGDSGGPLVAKTQLGIHMLLGLTSFGTEKCNIGAPVVFTRVTSYLDWIRQNSGVGEN